MSDEDSVKARADCEVWFNRSWRPGRIAVCKPDGWYRVLVDGRKGILELAFSPREVRPVLRQEGDR